MQFYDEVKISVQSGKGGDGIATGRREAGVPYGGPSWGNGGKGGSVIFKASKDENTLIPYKYRKNFKAHYGEPGRGRDQYGANSADLVLIVPIGTLVRDDQGDILHIFSQDEEMRTAVKWGEGWVGNMHFKDAVHQYPNFYLCGEPGQSRDLTLELQLIADVALIGTPSVGKSSIINTISHAKAKVAEYPFTTLVPNLGSVQHLETTFNVIDIPGLIKGAAEGKGLGNAFLRHVLKAKVFCLVTDCARYESGIQELIDVLEEIIDYIDQKFENPKITIVKQQDIITLLAHHDDELILEKRILFVINKFDLINDMDIMKEETALLWTKVLAFFKTKKLWTTITKTLLQKYTFIVSAATQYGINDRLNAIVPLLKNTKNEDVYHIPADKIAHQDEDQEMMISNISEEEKEMLIDEWYIEETQSKYNEVWEIQDPEICKLVRMLPRGNDEAEERFWKIMGHKGILEIFEQHHIHKGDILKIKSYYAGKEDRYILY